MKQLSASKKGSGAWRWGGPAVFTVVAGLIVAGILIISGQPAEVDDRVASTTVQSPVPHLVDGTNPDLRTVMIFDTGPLQPSQPGGSVTAELLRGSMPAGGTTATVLSDEDCAPDGYGISHCTNRMELADGSRLTVRHNHRMAEVSCLSPGEEVNVSVA